MRDRVLVGSKQNREGLSSAIIRNRWLVAGSAIAVLNPLPSGVILGIVMLTEEKLVKSGRIVLGVSVILVIISFLILLFSPKRS